MQKFIKKLFHFHKYKITHADAMSVAYCKVKKICTECKHIAEGVMHKRDIKKNRDITELDK